MDKISIRYLYRFIQWESLTYARAVRFWFENIHYRRLDNLNVLEIGGGKYCDLSLIFADLGASAICSDVYEANLEKAIKLHKSNFPHLINRLSYMHLDALEMNFVNEFDIITFKSVMGGVSRNQKHKNKKILLDKIHIALKPGGYLLFVENLEGCFIHKFVRRKFVPWGKRWNYLNLEEVENLFYRFSRFDYSTYGFIGFMFPYKLRNIGGTIDLLLEKFRPPSCAYLMSGIAQK